MLFVQKEKAPNTPSYAYTKHPLLTSLDEMSFHIKKKRHYWLASFSPPFCVLPKRKDITYTYTRQENGLAFFYEHEKKSETTSFCFYFKRAVMLEGFASPEKEANILRLTLQSNVQSEQNTTKFLLVMILRTKVICQTSLCFSFLPLTLFRVLGEKALGRKYLLKFCNTSEFFSFLIDTKVKEKKRNNEDKQGRINKKGVCYWHS